MQKSKNRCAVNHCLIISEISKLNQNTLKGKFAEGSNSLLILLLWWDIRGWNVKLTLVPSLQTKPR